jgi:RNA polymerase sigma factor (sigma-70 family)
MYEADTTLLQRWQRRRDADAFASLMQRYSGVVFGTCRRVLGDASLAEEVAQDCFVELMKTGDSIKVSLGAWLHTIAVRRSCDRIKGDARRRAREHRHAETRTDAVVPPDAAVEEVLSYVDEAIQLLPEELRSAMVGRFLENETHVALAQREGVAESTIRARIDRGVTQVRQSLKRRGVTVGVTGLTAALAEAAGAAPASLVTALNKLAVSGAMSGSAVAAGLSIKSVMVVAAIAVIGIAVWFGASVGTESPGVPTETAPITQAQVTSPAEPPPVKPDPSTQASASPQEPATVTADQPEPEEEPYSVSGRIYDADTEQGIAGAKIRAVALGGGPILFTSEPTGDDGRYVVPPLEDGSYRVSISSDLPAYPDPRRSQAVAVTLVDAKPATGIDFALTRGVPVTGRIVDASGQGVRGAKIGATSERITNPINGNSRDGGVFTVYLPEPTATLSLQAQTDTFESPTQTNLTVSEKGLVGLVLTLDQPRSAVVSGVVIDGAGQVVKGAQLHLLRKSHDVFKTGGYASADADGHFRIEGIAEGEYAVIVTPAEANGYSTSDELLRVAIAPGDLLNGLEIVLGDKGGLAIAGHVKDSKGNPVQGARIVAYGETRESSYTDGKGAFMLSGLSEGEYSVQVESPGFSRNSATIAAGTLDAELVLPSTGGIRGTVIRKDTGETFTQFTMAYIYGEVEGLNSMLYSGGQPVDSPDGTFARNELSAGPISVTVWAPGFAPQSAAVQVVSDEAAELRFELEPAVPVEGIVIDGTGSSVTGARVYFVRNVDRDSMDRVPGAITDADGRFVMDSLPAEAEQLFAYKVGYGVGSSPISDAKRIVLPAGATVVGTLEYADRIPADMLVNAFYPDSKNVPSMYARPLDDGTFTISDLSPGQLRISAYGNGTPRHQVTRLVDIVAGESVELTFPFEWGTGTVSGTVTVGGEPAPRTRVWLDRILPDRTEKRDARADENGVFAFDEVWEGDLVLRVTRYHQPDPESPHESIDDELPIYVAPGATVNQDLALDVLPE